METVSRNIHHAKTVDELYKDCDYITIHVPALEDTKGMINKDAMGLMKDGVVILNFARDVLVDQKDIVEALESEKYIVMSQILRHRRSKVQMEQS